MRWPVSLGTKVLYRLDKSRAKVHLPEAIYRDASCQRVCAVYQPARQAQTVIGPPSGHRRENGRDTRRDPVARIVVRPALKYKRIARLALGHHHHCRNGVPETLALRARGAQVIA